ncbi:MAG: SIMPL domain-containing protein, partial [Candidatus Uhrbacteria bacterium]|nr:SIMPL domain-containing protein [Candidatus Uhrbacteria bacterium]
MVLNRFFQGLLSVLGVMLIALVGLVIAVKAYDVRDIVRGNIFPAKTVNTTGEARVYAKPDMAYLVYDIVAEGKDEKEAREKYQKKMQDFFDGLKSMGIDRSNVTAAAFFMNEDESAAKDKRFKATVSVSVKIEEKKAIDDTLKAVYDLAVKQGLKTTVGGGYNTQCAGFKDQTIYFTSELRAQATENARKKAEELVGPTSLNLGRIVGVSSYDSAMYYPQAGSCPYPVPGVPLAPVELVTSINLTFEV